MDALQIKNLSFSYNDKEEFIKDLSLNIEKGAYVTLLGHNGSGKSTLAKLIMGLLPFEHGEIYVSNNKLEKKNLTTIRNKATIVFQNPDNQFIGITVEDDIAFSLENRLVAREEMEQMIKDIAKKVGMEEFLAKEPAYLSGGQKQRVAIADSLVINPDVLILDEATSMLDPKGKREILDLIKKMREDNPDLTVISITHDVEEAYLSDRVILLDKGRVIANENSKHLFEKEDLISKYNLDIPFEIKIEKELKNAGFAIKNEDSLEEIGDKLCR